MIPARRIALAAITVLTALLALAPAASADRTFSLRYQTVDRADTLFVANTLMTCSGAGCANVRNGTDTNNGNGDFNEINVDQDSDGTTFNSSSANLALPAGATVLFAGLYWGADTSAGTNGSAAPSAAANNVMKFRSPVLASYQSVTASVVDTDSIQATRYQGFADVTALVQAGGAGTYWGASVQAGTGQDRYAGWTLSVVYKDPAKGFQQVGVYDGLTSLVSGTRPSVSIPLDSFLTPASGTVNAKVGLVAWEGDNDINSETATLNGSTLTDAVNAANDVFNSTISRAGAHVTAKSPNYVNQLGIDADEITANGFIPNSATSTTLALGTTQDTYVPGVVTLVNDTYLQAPANTGLPSVTGTTVDRSVLTANPGTWTGAPAPTFTYQWRRCNAAGASCVDIAGSTSSTYTLATADVGSTIRVIVTGTSVAGTASATSGQSAVITALAPFATTAPTLSGTAQDGQVLTLSQGVWDGTPTITYARSWQRCNAAGASCVAIAGQTGTTYTLTSTDVGSTIRGVVTATNAGGSTPGTTTQSAVVTATPPVNTAVPTLSGTAREGLALTSTTGTWTGTPTITYAYQWQRCNAAGSSCADIAGAISASYTAVTADVGNTLRSRVTGTNAAGNASAVSAVSAVVAAAPPVNTVLPVISGTARDTQTLSATTGTWTGTPTITYAYQWQRCDTSGAACQPILGATSATYVLTSADVGGTARVVVTGTNAAGNSSATSAASATIVPTLPVNTVLPVISGTLTEGSTVTGSTGTWTGTPTITYAYQWQRCNAAGNSCANIVGSTASTYTLVAADVGVTLRFVVTATNAAGSASATSAAATGNPGAPANTALPTITGTARDGQTLTAGNGTWTGSAPITYTYQWQRCNAAGASCVDIVGSTASTRALVPADVGSTMRVRVTATNAAGSAQATSAQTAVVVADPPVNTVLPTISGTARDGQTLTAAVGTWTGTPTITYANQWRRCNAAGTSCADIAGATGATYVQGPADVGATIRVRVTGTNAGGSSSADSNPTATVAPDPPVNTVLPTITGTARDGQTLTSAVGTWTGTPTITYSRQWRRCNAAGTSCADIAGATGTTYVLTAADVAGTVRVRITGTNAGGSSSADSNATATVAPDPPVNTVLPTITGTARDGQTLTSAVGTWTGTPTITYTRQWRRCNAAGNSCADIAGATGTTYVLVTADIGSTIRVRITGTNAGGSSSADSAASATVIPDPPVNTLLPTITGTARDGQTLTSAVGTWTGTPTITYTRQWRRCNAAGTSCADIAGATGTTYVLTAADVAGTVRVRVTATNAGGSTSADSNQTATVAPDPPVNTVLPTISGTVRDGQTLTAAVGTWTGTPTITYANQWRRCNAAGTSCADIAGATGATYAVVTADVGSTLRVRITGTNAAGSADADSSATVTVAPAPPVVVDLPTISGTLQDGQTLTSTDGVWTGTPTITYARVWRRCDSGGSACVNIPGATGVTYDLTSDDVGATIRVRVTATNGGGSANASSLPSAAVDPLPPVNTAVPTITGTTRDTQTLTAHDGTWTGSPPIDFTYQWQRCDAAGQNCSSIFGATAVTYDLTSLDVGGTMRVVVTGSNDGGNSAATSAQTAVIDPTPPVNLAPPTISGTLRDGQTVTATSGSWAGSPTISYDYQWLRCDAAGDNCADVTGATAATYDLTADDVDGTMRVRVTATNAAGDADSSSDATGVVDPAPPVNLVAPTISGTERDGQTLSSTVGDWAGTPTISYARQWLRCDNAGDNCADIAGETGATYVLTLDDVDATIRLRVTATNAAGSDSADSDATGVVNPAPPVNTVVPAISGTIRDGQTVSATSGDWTGTPTISYDYQWLRCDTAGDNCAGIAFATGTTYVLTAADVDATIRVRVTATNSAGDASADSDPTAAVAPDPPVNTALPLVSGTVRDGQTLSSTVGAWTGTPTITYARQWLRCDAAGDNCAGISGATGASYDLTPADVAGTIRLRVTATNAGGSVDADSDPTSAVAADPPVNTSLPTISGTVTDGHTLTAARGTWTGTPTIGYGYQWLRCDTAGDNCDDIAGATNTTYDLVAADVDATIRVSVTATNAAGDAAASSAPTSAVAPAAPSNSGAPSISGTATDGQTLTAAHGAWTGTPTITYAYQWRRCDAAGLNCSDVSGATGVNYDLTPADIGSTMRVRVTAGNAGGDVSASSPASAVVAAIPPANTVLPTTSGTPRDGQTVSATSGTWTGSPTITYAYQWQRCDTAGAGCADISGATNATHDLTTADIGATLRVVVTGSNAGGSTPATSAPTATVAAITAVNTGTPTISGEPEEGGTLTADHGTWTGSAPITYTYQWQRCDAAGSNCVDISGATGPTRDLTTADVGATLRVVVTATNAAGPVTKASAVTAVVKAAPVTPTPPTPTPPTPTPPAPVGPSSEPVADDLGQLDGGLLTDSTCRQVVTGVGFRRLNVPGVGAIRLRLKADGAVAPDAPLGVELTGPARKISSVKLTLDGHALRTGAKRGKWSTAVSPKVFAAGDAHTLSIAVKLRKGGTRTLTEAIKTAACATRYTAGQWKTNVGTGLRLRVDSRSALSSVTFPLNAKLAARGALKAQKGLGRLRFVQAGGVRTILQLGATKGAPKGVLLPAATAGAPSVVVSGRTITVLGLPAGTGIVELTLYHRGAKLLRAKPRLTAAVTGPAGAPATLKTKLQRVTGR